MTRHDDTEPHTKPHTKPHTGSHPESPTGAQVHRDLLTPSQLADRWGVSTGHLANLRHLGDGIGYLKIGARVAYRYADVIAYESAHYISVD